MVVALFVLVLFGLFCLCYTCFLRCCLGIVAYVCFDFEVCLLIVLTYGLM